MLLLYYFMAIISLQPLSARKVLGNFEGSGCRASGLGGLGLSGLGLGWMVLLLGTQCDCRGSCRDDFAGALSELL